MAKKESDDKLLSAGEIEDIVAEEKTKEEKSNIFESATSSDNPPKNVGRKGKSAKSSQYDVEKKRKVVKKAESIVAALFLEPCILLVSTSGGTSDSSGYDIEAIPGFFDPKRKRFLKMSVSSVDMDGFDEAFKPFAEDKLLLYLQQENSKKISELG